MKLYKKLMMRQLQRVNITFLTRDHSTSLQYDNVEDIGEINNALMV